MPVASSESIRAKMAAQRGRDTACEMTLRRELHRSGLRYFVHRKPVKGVRREADIVFPKAHVAVFVDGCFGTGVLNTPLGPRRTPNGGGPSSSEIASVTARRMLVYRTQVGCRCGFGSTRTPRKQHGISRQSLTAAGDTRLGEYHQLSR